LSCGERERTDERVEVLGVAAVEGAGQEPGDDAARDLAEDIDPDLVPVAVEDDGRAKGTCWADGAARECSRCANQVAWSTLEAGRGTRQILRMMHASLSLPW